VIKRRGREVQRIPADQIKSFVPTFRFGMHGAKIRTKPIPKTTPKP
jgi:hypothetical protein